MKEENVLKYKEKRKLEKIENKVWLVDFWLAIEE